MVDKLYWVLRPLVDRGLLGCDAVATYGSETRVVFILEPELNSVNYLRRLAYQISPKMYVLIQRWKFGLFLSIKGSFHGSIINQNNRLWVQWAIFVIVAPLSILIDPTAEADCIEVRIYVKLVWCFTCRAENTLLAELCSPERQLVPGARVVLAHCLALFIIHPRDVIDSSTAETSGGYPTEYFLRILFYLFFSLRNVQYLRLCSVERQDS